MKNARVPAWKIAAAVTALRREFPRADVLCVFPPRGDAEAFTVWRCGGLCIAPAVFHRCHDEAAVEAVVSKAAERMREGHIVEIA